MKAKKIVRTTGNLSVCAEKKRYRCSHCGNVNWLENWIKDDDT